MIEMHINKTQKYKRKSALVISLGEENNRSRDVLSLEVLVEIDGWHHFIIMINSRGGIHMYPGGPARFPSEFLGNLF